MKEFRVEVVERVRKSYIVRAEDEEEAEELYLDGELESVEKDRYPDIVDVVDITEE